MKQHSKVYKQVTVIMRSSSTQRSYYSCQYHVYIHTSVVHGHGYFTHYRGAELLKVWTRIDLLQWSLDTRINLLQWSLATCIYILQWSSIPNSSHSYTSAELRHLYLPASKELTLNNQAFVFSSDTPLVLSKVYLGVISSELPTMNYNGHK